MLFELKIISNFAKYLGKEFAIFVKCGFLFGKRHLFLNLITSS